MVRFDTASYSESRVKDRQRNLSRTAQVLEALHASRLVNRQVVLSVLELLEKSVTEDVDFVQITRTPLEMPLSAHIRDFQHSVSPQLALDADGVVLGVRGAQVWIETAHGSTGECLVRHIEEFRISRARKGEV